MARDKFRAWIEKLDRDVIQGEFGYEEGEFNVYPERWRALFNEGLTPQQAWKRALNAFAQGRRDDARDREENYRRIQLEDAMLLAKGSTP